MTVFHLHVTDPGFGLIPETLGQMPSLMLLAPSVFFFTPRLPTETTHNVRYSL